MIDYFFSKALASSWDAIDPTKGSAGGDLVLLLNQLLNRIPYFLGGLALLALLYSGFLYITAFGDSTKMEMAKKNITWTVIGILAIAFIYIVIDLILSIFKPMPI